MAIFTSKNKRKGEKTAVKPAKIRRARLAKLAAGAAHEIIRAPWFSEKALIATEKGEYAFAVSPRATKSEIAAAIKEIYNVEPRSVSVIRLPGKRKAMRTRHGVGTRSARHKAYVRLNKGDTIKLA